VFIRIAAAEGAEEKRKAKAAVDLVGSQAGKTGGGLLVQGLVLAFGSTAAAAPASAAVFAASVAAWWGATVSLAREMDRPPPPPTPQPPTAGPTLQPAAGH
jgi:ATP:ADP antiporter, AAA family